LGKGEEGKGTVPLPAFFVPLYTLYALVFSAIFLSIPSISAIFRWDNFGLVLKWAMTSFWEARGRSFCFP
jgi:hypothetical protein